MSSAKNALIDDTENEQGVDSEGRENIVFQKDTKYSWCVCTCAFFTQIFVLGVLHAFGVFFVEFVREFNASKGSTAWIGSLAYGLSMTFSPVTSQLLTRYSYSRVMMAGGILCVLSLFVSSFVSSVTLLYFTFSIFYGVGTCMCTAPTMTITPEYFDKYMSIATGITVSGSSFGTLIMGPLSQFIIDKAGWRTAFRVYAGLIIITIALNSRIRAPPSVTKRKLEGRSFIKDLQIWKNRVFVVWTIAITLVMFGFYIPYVHLVSYAVDQGISPDMASFLMMILGATTAVGRIMFGKIVQLGILNRLHMHQLSMVITGTGVMLLPLITSYTGIVLYVITVGLVDGCFVVLLPIMTASLIGIEKSVVAWGFLIGTCSLTFTLGPPVAGALYDLTGTYNIAFHCAGIPIVLGAVILFLIPWAQRTSRGTNVLTALTEITLQASSQDSPSGVFRTDSGGTICGNERLVHSERIGSVNAAVQTMISTPTSMKYSDKSTSTEDVSLNKISLDMSDALSQLSYTSRVFEDTSHQSLSSGHGQRVISDSKVIPKIDPPSEQAHSQRSKRDRQEMRATSVSSNGSHISSHNEIIDEHGHSQNLQLPSHIKSEQSFTYQSISSEQFEQDPSSLQQIDRISFEQDLLHAAALSSHSILSESTSGSIPSSHLSSLQVDPLQPTKAKQQSPKQDSLCSSQSVVEGNISKQSSNFDQTISDQVNMLRDTLKSPTPCSSKMEEVEQISSPRQEDASSFVKNINNSLKNTTNTGLSNPFLESECTVSGSDTTQLIEEAMETQDIKDSNSLKHSNLPSTELSDSSFNSDNQLTVIPATNPFSAEKSSYGCSKLEELFKPITEDEQVQQKVSYEVINTDSVDQIQQTASQTGELDMFTHLFQDEET